MASTTFIDRTTPIYAAWLNDVDAMTYYGTLYIVKTTDTVAIINSALTTYPGIVFKSGKTYNISGDVSIPSNRKIIVEKGATVINTGGRFTADTVSNVEWIIDGWVKSVAMTTAPAKTSWTSETPAPRGFIEFGYNYSSGVAGDGFWVHGTGKISGDWTGTPNYSDPTQQTNRKGIAIWNGKNCAVDGLEVFGFDGEAVYASFFDTASKNIVFRNNYVHDTRFNSLNFNSGANGGGCKIIDNITVNAYQVEISSGECSRNHISNMITNGIYTGSGAGYGEVVIKDNVIRSSGIYGIIAAYASGTPVTGVTIENNAIYNSGSYSIYMDYCNEFTIIGNKCVGTGQSVGSYHIGVLHSNRGVVDGNTFLSPGAFCQSGQFYVDTTCKDVALSPTTNFYIATTGTAQSKTGTGVVTIASAAALPIPVYGSIFSVSGTTTITSITAAVFDSNHNGREITLIFQGALTFTDGSNLKLAGNFVTTANDTITLVSDGTNWYEKARSVN